MVRHSPASGSCVSPSHGQEPDAQGTLATLTDAIQGFELRSADSGFEAANPQNVKETTTLGNLRISRSDSGVFTVNERNGAVRSIPNADAPTSKLPPFGDSHEAHNERAVDYFTSAGMPAEQIGTVQALPLVGNSDADGAKPSQSPQLLARYSVVNRSIEGFPVEDSVAWVRFADSGEVVSETVYWPPIPKSVVEAARRLDNATGSGSARASFAQQLPRDIEDPQDGRVCIRHSSLDEDDFEAVAVYEVLDRKSDRGRLRLFDEDAQEVYLARHLDKASGDSRSRP